MFVVGVLVNSANSVVNDDDSDDAITVGSQICLKVSDAVNAYENHTVCVSVCVCVCVCVSVCVCVCVCVCSTPLM